MNKRKIVKKDKPIIPLNLALFTGLISYLLSDYASRSFVVKLDQFFEEVNTVHYEEDGDLEIYYRIIRRITRMFLEDSIRDTDLIIDTLTDSPKDGDEISELLLSIADDMEDINSATAIFIENEIIDRLNFIRVTPRAEKLRLALSRFDNQDYVTYSEIIRELQTNTSDLNKAIIAKATTAITIPDVTFGRTDSFFSAVRKVRNYMNDDKRLIKTGLKRLNKFLGGGWQAGRVYLANGISGGWKSGLLLNAALWCCKYNDDIVCNDRSKRPCVVYLTQENDNEETIQRIISYVGGVNEKGKAVAEEILEKKFLQHKLIEGRWELRIIYRPKNSISTGDVDSLIAEIEAEGEVEVKFLVHDYMKRIKPDVVTGDLRIDLGEAANDLSIIAKRRKIPILTANQLNREAYRALNEHAKNDNPSKNKLDQGRKLDPSMISESQLLLENVDFAFGQHREQTADGSVFIAFKKFKDRADKSVNVAASDYFAHPFSPSNGMQLVEDFLLESSMSIDSVEAAFGGNVIDEDIEEEDDDVLEEATSKRKSSSTMGKSKKSSPPNKKRKEALEME